MTFLRFSAFALLITWQQNALPSQDDLQYANSENLEQFTKVLDANHPPPVAPKNTQVATGSKQTKKSSLDQSRNDRRSFHRLEANLSQPKNRPPQPIQRRPQSPHSQQDRELGRRRRPPPGSNPLPPPPPPPSSKPTGVQKGFYL